MRPDLRIFCILAVALTGLSLLAVALIHPHGGTSVLWPAGPGRDFSDYEARLAVLHSDRFFTDHGFRWYYPAPAILPYALFHAIATHSSLRAAHGIFLTLTACLVVALAWFFNRALCRNGLPRPQALTFTVVTLLTAWPIYFSLQRSNYESLLWMLLAAAIWAITRHRPMLGAVLLGIVGAFKIYPLLCLALFLRGRQWKPILTGLAVTAGITLVSLRIIHPSILYAARQIAAGVRAWTAAYALDGWHGQMGYDHSFFEIVKGIFSPLHADDANLLRAYIPIAALLATAVFVLRVRRLPLLNQTLFLIALATILPPTSFDYTLQNLYIPFAWLAVYVLRHPPRAVYTTLMALFAIILAPVSFVYLGGYLGGPIKCLAVLGIIGIAAVVPFDSPEGTATAHSIPRTHAALG